MKRIKTFIAALFGCAPNAEYGGQAIMVKKPFVNPCTTPLIRRVSTMRTVNINGCLYSTPDAEVGALIQLTPLNGGWYYQAQHEEPFDLAHQLKISQQEFIEYYNLRQTAQKPVQKNHLQQCLLTPACCACTQCPAGSGVVQPSQQQKPLKQRDEPSAPPQ